MKPLIGITVNYDIKDEIIEQAAKDAQTTADGKITSFYQNTVPTNASHGDIWYAFGNVPDSYTNGKIYRYDANAKKWSVIEDKSALDAIKALEDGQIITYYSKEIPTTPHEGDLWYVDSDSDVTKEENTYKAKKLYRYSGSVWEPIHDAEITKAIEAAKTEPVQLPAWDYMF